MKMGSLSIFFMLCYSIWDEVTHARIERPVDLRARGAPRTMQTHSSSQREILPLRMPARDEKQKARFSRAIKYASPTPPTPTPLLCTSFSLSFSLIRYLSWRISQTEEMANKVRRLRRPRRRLFTSRSRGGTTFEQRTRFLTPNQLCLPPSLPISKACSGNGTERMSGRGRSREPTETAETER